MLATLVEAPPRASAASTGGSPDRSAPDNDGYVYELKYDGFRAMAAIYDGGDSDEKGGRRTHGRVALRSRNGRDLEDRFPDVPRALAGIDASHGVTVIDGEIVALDAIGTPRFGHLQAGHPTIFVAFDLLKLDGQDVRARPIEERRRLLDRLVTPRLGPSLRLAERVPGPALVALQQARERGFEGVVGKRRGSRYEAGRTRNWIKLKLQREQEVAVVGYTSVRGCPSEIGALLVAVARQGTGLTYAGKVGTGFSAAQRVALMKRLAPKAIARPAVANAPRSRAATWVMPGEVAQVRFHEWTDDGLLRHPVFVGLRDDKAPLECPPEPF